MADKSQDPTPTLQYFNSQMDECTTDYAVFVLELLEKAYQASADPLFLLEQKLDYSKFAPEGFGTCDCLIVADYTMYVVDFKYGANLVFAENNPQLMLYALAALDLYGGIYNIERVCMAIFQPRREHISMSVKSTTDLYKWAEDSLKPAAQLAFAGEGEFAVGDHCQFCKVNAQCRARYDHNMEITRQMFKQPALLEDSEIVFLLGQLDGFKSWADAVQTHALKSALSGKEWQGYKLVSGRATRKFTDKKAVEAAVLAEGYTEIYKPQELLSLTDLERLMKKEKFNAVLGGFITKPPGKPSLVPESDKRKAMSLDSAAMDAFAAEPIEQEDV